MQLPHSLVSTAVADRTEWASDRKEGIMTPKDNGFAISFRVRILHELELKE